MMDQRTRDVLVNQLCDQVRQMATANMALTTLVGVVIWSSFPTTHVFGWMLFGYAISLPRLFVLQWLRPRLPAHNNAGWTELAVTVILGLSGLQWGLAGWLFLNPSDTTNFAMVSGAVLGVASAGLSGYSIRPLVYSIFVVCIFSGLIIKFVVLESWGLAVMCFVVMGAYSVLSRGLGTRIERSVTQDFRNAELLEEVSEAKELADKANLEKSMFMAATSHDLRQPLHAQSLLLEILKHRDLGGENDAIVSKLSQSNDALNALFNSLLEVSQLDAGTIEVHAGDHSAMDIAQLIIEEYRELADRKGLELNLTGEDHAIFSDPVLVTRILRNLVSNAVKFTDNGSVTVDVQQLEDQVIVTVADTGTGIPLDAQEKIFSEYTQLGNEVRDRSKGIGLGLALVRRLCELLDHEISLESTEGEGSSFRLSLPTGDSSKILQPVEESQAHAIPELDIMIIDDEQPILEAMQKLLLEWQCTPIGFTSYLEAKEAIRKNNYKPDLILCDYRLGADINGVEAIKLLRDHLGSQVPAILISGDTDPKLLESINQQDFYLLHKPLMISRFRRVVSILMSGENN